MTQLEALQGTGQIHQFTKCWKSLQTHMGQSLWIGLSWAQMVAGTSQSIVKKTATPLPHLKAQWFGSLQSFLYQSNATFTLNVTYTIPKQQRYDQHIMDVAIKSSIFFKKQIQLLNYCRLYLEVTLILDITSADGTKIYPSMWISYSDDLPPST